MREGSAAKAEAPQKIDDGRLSYVGLGATAEAMGSPANHTGPDRHPLRMSTKSDQHVGDLTVIGGRHLRLAGAVTP
jgi:hypothetical protein